MFPHSSTASSQQTVILSYVPFQGAEVITVMALFSVSSSARYIGIFVVIVVVQENTWIYFTYLTNIFPASSFPLPTLPLQLQHSPSVLLVWVRHSSVPQRSEVLQHWSSCAGLSSPLLKWWYLLCGSWLHCVPTPHFLYPFIFWWTSRWFCVLLLLIKLQCAHSPAACLTGASFTHMPSSRLVTHSF